MKVKEDISETAILQISFDEPKMSLLAFVIAKQFHAPKLSQTSLAA